jgi:hypothetical protein
MEGCTMKKVISIAAGVVLVCFTTMAFAADLANPITAAAAAANTAVKDQAVKAVNGQIVVGTIKKIDPAAKTIFVKDMTINVKADEITALKKGDKVKITLAAGTMNAEKIVPLGKKAAKKEVKKEATQAKDKAIDAAAQKAVEKMGQ